MADGEGFTVYDTENQQMAMNVNAGAGGDDGQVQSIQYITQDNVHVAHLAHGGQDVVQVTEAQGNILSSLTGGTFTGGVTGGAQVITGANNAGSLVVSTPQNLAQSVVQQPANVIQAPQVVQQQAQNASGNVTSIGVPHMLFLNQVTINGQTSFVLVDANNKPVQLPQGIQVINLPSQQLGQQLPVSPDTGDEPLYVNAKQYHRILKRRQARARLEALGKIPKERQKYLYESRHRHAVNRQRGTGGVFVSGGKKDESELSNQNRRDANGGVTQHHAASESDILASLQPLASKPVLSIGSLIKSDGTV
ncbi:hypothetical protein ScPMuIL_000533 [Solemya velum]